MESVWQSRLLKENWPQRAIDQLPLCLAPSTLNLYNRILQRFRLFCCVKGYQFLPVNPAVIVEYLCSVCDGSDKPRSMLKNTAAAVSCLCEASKIDNVMDNSDVRRFLQALIKSGTVKPMKHSSVMPVEKFHGLFCDWPDNDQLSEKQLRLKTITLLALVAMLRPSDIAPQSVVFDPVECVSRRRVFSTSQIIFGECDMTISFHGIKNDTSRAGFVVTVPKTSNVKIDPVQCMLDYVKRTESVRPVRDSPVFLTLTRPRRAIDAVTVANILQEAIKLADLDTALFSAKSFRPTGATVAIDNGFNPESVMKIGRWKTQSVFFDHYVHSKTPGSFCDKVLQSSN